MSRSSCDWGQLILMALRLLSRTAVLHVMTSVRHCSEAWSCGPEESSEPRCVSKTSAGKTLASLGFCTLDLAGSTRVRNTRHDGVNIRALKPARG